MNTQDTFQRRESPSPLFQAFADRRGFSLKLGAQLLLLLPPLEPHLTDLLELAATTSRPSLCRVLAQFTGPFMLASVSATMHCRGVQSEGWGWRTACQVGPRPREATKEACISRPPSPVGCHLADGPAGRNGRDAWPLCGPSAPACRPIAPRCPLRAWIGPPSPLSAPFPPAPLSGWVRPSASWSD